MPVTRIRDAVLEIAITSGSVVDCLGADFRAITVATGRLNEALPMVSYDIARVGVTDVWNLTALAVDTRAYSSTISIPASTPLYTLTTLPAGTDAEILAFLNLARAFAAILKTKSVSAVAIDWTP